MGFNSAFKGLIAIDAQYKHEESWNFVSIINILGYLRNASYIFLNN